MKPWYKSWTLWFNFLMGLATLLVQLSQDSALPAEVGATLLAIGNFLLRFKTVRPLKSIL